MDDAERIEYHFDKLTEGDFAPERARDREVTRLFERVLKDNGIYDDIFGK